MKLYLDDERPCPDNWYPVLTAQEAISLLKTGVVTHISLDHDLGPPEAGTGYDVACWIELESHMNKNFNQPLWRVHSANPIVRIKMNAALRNFPHMDG